jgi:hypothetical protein
MSQDNRCHWCKRIIEDENDMVVQNINTGFLGLSEQRVAFHIACLENYRMSKRRETILILSVCAAIILVPPLIIIIIQFLLSIFS